MNQLIGKKPTKTPPRTEDFDVLERQMIDILVDSIKYIAATCGIVIAVYSQILQGYLNSPRFTLSSWARFILFIPLFFWFLAIVGTVVGIYPRTYKARTDLDKQVAINRIRETKKHWLVTVLFFFLTGFAVFIYVISSEIWGFFPFR